MALVRSPKEPQGATYTLSDGSTVTKTGETISSETQYYNVVQVTKGSLTLDGCTLTKTGDGTSGDNKVAVEVGQGVTWQLTADTNVNTLVNNGAIVTNGYTLNVSGSSSGTGTVSETTGIRSLYKVQQQGLSIALTTIFWPYEQIFQV